LAHTPSIFINGRFLQQDVTGVQRYARETLACMDELYPQWAAERGGIPATVLVPVGTPDPGMRHLQFREVGRLQGHAWEQLDLAWHARRGLLFSFGFTGPVLHSRQIITVHDAAVQRIPHAYTWRFRWWYSALVRALVHRAPLVATVSNFSRQEAIDVFGATPQQTRVTTEGWQHLNRIAADEAILDRHDLRAQPFVLAVSSQSPNKNFAAVVQAMAMLGSAAPTCVVAGGANNRIFQGQMDSGAHLKQVGYVSDAELKALYQNASCFVFPSIYEGFGIPPLEAMSQGCPVIASTASAVREVCGDAALYFDPTQPRQLADRLLQFFQNPHTRALMASAGRARASQYTWRQAASLNLALIGEALSA
jgi:glycosyltransferase involved in cell wall biosynthesis